MLGYAIANLKGDAHCPQLSRHSTMDAEFSCRDVFRVYAILGFWIAANPVAMT
jgi:hypothetical protein